MTSVTVKHTKNLSGAYKYSVSYKYIMKFSPIINRNLHFKFFFNVCFWEREIERERERAWMEEGQRGRGRQRIQSRHQALSCQHRAYAGLEFMNCEIMTWAEVGHPADWATQALLKFFILIHLIWSNFPASAFFKKDLWVPCLLPLLTVEAFWRNLYRNESIWLGKVLSPKVDRYLSIAFILTIIHNIPFLLINRIPLRRNFLLLCL